MTSNVNMQIELSNLSQKFIDAGISANCMI